MPVDVIEGVVVPALIGIAFIVWFSIWLNNWGKKNRRRMLERAVQSALAGRAFAPTYSSELNGIHSYVAIDMDNERLAVADLGKGSIVGFDDLIRVEPLFDGSPVQHGGTGATTGALVGLALAGGLGAIIGAFAGSGRKVRKLSLRVVTNDIAAPVKELVFLASGSAMPVDSKRVKAALAELEAWGGRIEIILHGRSQRLSAGDRTVGAGAAQPVALEDDAPATGDSTQTPACG